MRAQQDYETTSAPEVDKLVKDLQDKVRAGTQLLTRGQNSNSPSPTAPFLCCAVQWDKVENKTGVVLYGAGAFILLWFSSTLVSALNAIPLVGSGVTHLPFGPG